MCFFLMCFFLVSEVWRNGKIVLGKVYDCGMYTFGDTVFHKFSSETGDEEMDPVYHVILPRVEGTPYKRQKRLSLTTNEVRHAATKHLVFGLKLSCGGWIINISYILIITVINNLMNESRCPPKLKFSPFNWHVIVRRID